MLLTLLCPRPLEAPELPEVPHDICKELALGNYSRLDILLRVVNVQQVGVPGETLLLQQNA